ncbi:hypothetical protein D5S17_30705 [Pseudonocardiaceae bacterium YIM PH 21723]|nr:hypothetical protein D5S17_30705 [Pseudonocardiaceae bacterium YIM PH 21723]
MDDQFRTVLISGGRVVRVRRGSMWDLALSDGYQPDEQRLEMPWSLGFLGDVLWLFLPESRPVIRQLLIDNVDEAIEDSSSLFPLSDSEIAREVLWEAMVEPTLQGLPGTAARLTEYCDFLRFLLGVDNKLRVGVEYGKEVLTKYVLDKIDREPYWDMMNAHDPEFASLVRELTN